MRPASSAIWTIRTLVAPLCRVLVVALRGAISARRPGGLSRLAVTGGKGVSLTGTPARCHAVGDRKKRVACFSLAWHSKVAWPFAWRANFAAETAQTITSAVAVAVRERLEPPRGESGRRPRSRRTIDVSAAAPRLSS